MPTTSPLQTIAMPGRYAFPVWATWVLERGPWGHPTLAMRTDHRADPFSEYLLYDLETGHYRGIVFDDLPEVWWGCLLRKPHTENYYALLPKRGIVALDWETGTTTSLGTVAFPDGELPRYAAWEDAETLWIITHGEHPGLYRATLTDATLTRVTDLAPPEKKTAYAYLPQQIALTPGGHIWMAFTPGLLVEMYDPATGALLIVRNQGEQEPVRFFETFVLVGEQAYDLETTGPLTALPPLPPHALAERWLDKVVGEDGGLYTQDGGALVYWGRKPSSYVIEPPSGDDRWQPGITWYAVHGRRAFGTSHMNDPEVGLYIYDADTGATHFEKLDWQPEKPQQFYSLHVGPDGGLYGSNYSQALWRVEPATGECRALGWAVPPRPGGEIWCFANADERMYFASYTQSWISVYDPAHPWHPGVAPDDNPYNILRLYDHAPDQHRPRDITRASDGLVYVASCADYGLSKDGALAAIDPATNTLAHVICPLLPDHQLISLAAPPSRSELYIGAYVGEWWLRATSGAYMVFDLASRELRAVHTTANTVTNLTLLGDLLLGVVRREWTIFFYNTVTAAYEPPALLYGERTYYAGPRPSRGTALIYQRGAVYEMDHARVLRQISPPGVEIAGSRFQEGVDGRIYYIDGAGFEIRAFTPTDLGG